MTLDSIIVDDEPLAHEVILSYAGDISYLEITGQFYSATEAVDYLNKHRVDLMFLDIEMPRLKGLEMLDTLREPPLVIVTTAYEEYALEGYELDVCDYLLKPFRFKRFLKAVQKSRERHRLRDGTKSTEGDSPAGPEVESIFIKSDGKVVQLQLDEIRYLESYGNYVKVWLDDHFLLTPRTLKSFEEELSDQLFLRIHKSLIINRSFIDYLEGNRIQLEGNERLPIGKTYRKQVKSQLSPD